MFHSTYTPEYFSLKQIKQLQDYNRTIQDLHCKELVNTNQNKDKYSYFVGKCSVL
jgi:hypothetical protein